MRTPMPEYELEQEYEGELEGEFESEAFFRRLAALARSPALQRLARRARRAALVGRAVGLSLNPLPAPALPVERPAYVDVAEPRRRGGMVQLPEEEWESEWEGEMNPLRRVYPDALMEHLGHAAAEAESEAEAEAFIGALVPLAARLVPRVAPAVMRAAPRLIQGAAGVARVLRRNPATRPLVRTLPTIVRRTAVDLARQAAQGRAITPGRAAGSLARQTATVLGSPGRCMRAWRRSRMLDRQYHRATGAGGACRCRCR